MSCVHRIIIIPNSIFAVLRMQAREIHRLRLLLTGKVPNGANRCYGKVNRFPIDSRTHRTSANCWFVNLISTTGSGVGDQSIGSLTGRLPHWDCGSEYVRARMAHRRSVSDGRITLGILTNLTLHHDWSNSGRGKDSQTWLFEGSSLARRICKVRSAIKSWRMLNKLGRPRSSC